MMLVRVAGYSFVDLDEYHQRENIERTGHESFSDQIQSSQEKERYLAMMTIQY